MVINNVAILYYWYNCNDKNKQGVGNWMHVNNTEPYIYIYIYIYKLLYIDIYLLIYVSGIIINVLNGFGVGTIVYMYYSMCIVLL